MLTHCEMLAVLAARYGSGRRTVSLRDFYCMSSPTIDPLLFVVPLRKVADDGHEQRAGATPPAVTMTTSNSGMTVCRMGRAVAPVAVMVNRPTKNWTCYRRIRRPGAEALPGMRTRHPQLDRAAA